MHKIRIQGEREESRIRFDMDMWGNWMALYANSNKAKDDGEYLTVADFYPREGEGNREQHKISKEELEERMKAAGEARKRKKNG